MDLSKEEKDYVIKALCEDNYDPRIEGMFNGDFAAVEINDGGAFSVFNIIFKKDERPFLSFTKGDADAIRKIILKIPNTEVVYRNACADYYIICDSSYGWRVIPQWHSPNHLELGHYGNDGKLERRFGTIWFDHNTVLSEYGWKLLRESPVTTIRYTRECDQTLYDAGDDFKKKINEIYNEMSDSDKLLLELGCD